jgi:hypothetical protein
MPPKKTPPHNPPAPYYDDLTDAEKAELQEAIEADETIPMPPPKPGDRDEPQADDIPF